MLPEEIAQIRSEAGLTPGEFAKLLAEATGMNYRATSVNAWEKGKRNIPDYVAQAAYDLSGKEAPPPDEFVGKSTDELTEEFRQLTADQQPEDSTPDPPAIPITFPTSLEQACIEMFQGIGMMVELGGQITGQPKVVTVLVPDSSGKQVETKISLIEYDGKIIQSDAYKLGKAWAKLAEKNEWVARILQSLTGGGAWVEALAATSGTMVKVYQNHMAYAEFIATRPAQSNGAVPAESPEESGATI